MQKYHGRLLCGCSIATILKLRSVLSSSLSRSGIIGGIHLLPDAAFLFADPHSEFLRFLLVGHSVPEIALCRFRFVGGAQNAGTAVSQQPGMGLRDNAHSIIPRFWG